MFNVSFIFIFSWISAAIQLNQFAVDFAAVYTTGSILLTDHSRGRGPIAEESWITPAMTTVPPPRQISPVYSVAWCTRTSPRRSWCFWETPQMWKRWRRPSTRAWGNPTPTLNCTSLCRWHCCAKDLSNWGSAWRSLRSLISVCYYKLFSLFVTVKSED